MPRYIVLVNLIASLLNRVWFLARWDQRTSTSSPGIKIQWRGQPPQELPSPLDAHIWSYFFLLSFRSEMLEMLLCLVSLTPHCHSQSVAFLSKNPRFFELHILDFMTHNPSCSSHVSTSNGFSSFFASLTPGLFYFPIIHHIGWWQRAEYLESHNLVQSLPLPFPPVLCLWNYERALK